MRCTDEPTALDDLRVSAGRLAGCVLATVLLGVVLHVIA